MIQQAKLFIYKHTQVINVAMSTSILIVFGRRLEIHFFCEINKPALKTFSNLTFAKSDDFHSQKVNT